MDKQELVKTARRLTRSSPGHGIPETDATEVIQSRLAAHLFGRPGREKGIDFKRFSQYAAIVWPRLAFAPLPLLCAALPSALLRPALCPALPSALHTHTMTRGSVRVCMCARFVRELKLDMLTVEFMHYSDGGDKMSYRQFGRFLAAHSGADRIRERLGRLAKLAVRGW